MIYVAGYGYVWFGLVSCQRCFYSINIVCKKWGYKICVHTLKMRLAHHSFSSTVFFWCYLLRIRINSYTHWEQMGLLQLRWNRAHKFKSLWGWKCVFYAGIIPELLVMATQPSQPLWGHSMTCYFRCPIQNVSTELWLMFPSGPLSEWSPSKQAIIFRGVKSQSVKYVWFSENKVSEVQKL